jgi:hypothetical protein
LEGSKYLDLAERMIAIRGIPLTGMQIIELAANQQVLPFDRYGTIVKTLQARIAEDIAKHRTRSRFVRTSIGTYFLRDFLDQSTIFGRVNMRIPRLARAKPEHPHRILFLPDASLIDQTNINEWSVVESLLLHGQYFYQFEAPKKSIPIVTSIILRWRGLTLTYTVGVHTHFTKLVGRRSFMIRKFLDEFDLDLFETDGTGATSSSARTLLPVLNDGRRSRLEAGKLTEPEKLQFFQVSEMLQEKRASYCEFTNTFIISSVVDVSSLYNSIPQTIRRLELNSAGWLPNILLSEAITDEESLRLLPNRPRHQGSH